MAYWETLHKILQEEPVEERDRFFMYFLKDMGIEKGKPFNPDARQKEILLDALIVGEAMAKNMVFRERLNQRDLVVTFSGSDCRHCFRRNIHWFVRYFGAVIYFNFSLGVKSSLLLSVPNAPMMSYLALILSFCATIVAYKFTKSSP